MDITYALAPLVAWFMAGSTKFAINSLKAWQPAFGQIGYGGLPSNHSAIVSSMAVLIALREGISHPAFGVALTLAFIVVLDATSLRHQVGKQAAALNRLLSHHPKAQPLRERMGHTRLEIGAGILIGILTACLIDFIIPHSA